jgi:hypothetical protein
VEHGHVSYVGSYPSPYLGWRIKNAHMELVVMNIIIVVILYGAI